MESASWRNGSAADGVLTLSDAPFQKTWAATVPEGTSIDYNSARADFQVGLMAVRSPLLGQSLLLSFPPLIDMLKFSGCSCLSSGREKEGLPFPEEGHIIVKDVNQQL